MIIFAILLLLILIIYKSHEKYRSYLEPKVIFLGLDRISVLGYHLARKTRPRTENTTFGDYN